MKKEILKSNAAFVVIGESPSWKSTPEVGRLFTLVQNCDINFNVERQTLKQLGSKKYIVNNITRSPNIDLNLSYYFSPYINNELLMGFNGYDEIDRPAFENIHQKNHNFYIVVNNKDGENALDEIKLDNPQNINYNDFILLSFGDCYLNRYSLGFSLGQVPIVSTSFKCSNSQFESRVSGISSPSQHPLKGNSSYLDINELYHQLSCGNIRGDIEGRNEYNPPVVVPHNSQFILQNLQVASIPLAKEDKPILQNFSIDINFDRVDLYGLGSNQPYDRKLQYPIKAEINLSSLVSGFNVGFLNKIEETEMGYDLDLSFSSNNANATGWYKFKNAKLNNFNYSMQINDIMKFNASFSVEIDDENGFSIHRRTRKVTTFADKICLWNNTTINWNEPNDPNPCEC
jgi:hypothetical protein